jgi:hypothetical protein
VGVLVGSFSVGAAVFNGGMVWVAEGAGISVDRTVGESNTWTVGMVIVGLVVIDCPLHAVSRKIRQRNRIT